MPKSINFDKIKTKLEKKEKLFISHKLEFSESEVKGELRGTLVNYNHKKLAHGWFKFARGSMKNNEGKILHALFMHENRKVPVGNMTGTETKDGFEVAIKLDLSLLENGNPINPAAHSLYSLMKNMGSTFELSVGGWIEEYAEKKNDGKRFVEIQNFDAYEGSIVMRGAVEGSTVNEIFEEMPNKKMESDVEMNKQEMEALFAEWFAKFVEMSDNKTSKELQSEFEEFKTDVEAKMKNVTNERITELEESLKASEELIAGVLSAKQTESRTELEAALDTYNEYLHAGREKAPSEFLDTTSGASLIPKSLSNAMSKDMKEVAPFYADGFKVRGKGTTIRVPVRKPNTTTSAKEKAEGVAPDTGATNLSEIELSKGVIQSTIPITDESRRDSQFNVAAIVREYSTEDIAENIAQKTYSGSLAGNNKIEGFTIHTEFEGRSVEETTQGEVVWDDLMAIKKKVKPQYWSGSKWYVSNDAYFKMKTMKDSTGRPLWQPSLIAGAPETFDGHPISVCWQMTDAYPVLFANFSKLYYYFEDYTMETERDRNATAGYDNEIVRARLGGKVANIEAGCMLKRNPA